MEKGSKGISGVETAWRKEGQCVFGDVGGHTVRSERRGNRVSGKGPLEPAGQGHAGISVGQNAGLIILGDCREEIW
jgi:hypothetical protein